MDTMSIPRFEVSARPQNPKELISQINARLAAHQGELVLLVEHEEEAYAPGRHGYHLEKRLYLGAINGDAIVRKNTSNHVIPTNGFTFCCSPSHEQRIIFTREGNLQSLKSLLDHLERPLQPKGYLAQLKEKMEEKQIMELELYIGDDEVATWVSDDQDVMTLSAMAKPLGRGLPPALKSRWKEAVTEKKKDALREVVGLIERYLILLEVIRAQGKPEDVEVDSSLSVFRDHEVLLDANEAAFCGPLGKMYEKLDELERELRTALTEAHHLRLSDRAIIAKMVHHYGETLSALFERLNPPRRQKDKQQVP